MVPETCTTLSSHRSRTAGSRQPHSQVWGSVRWYPRPVPHCPATDRARQVPASHTARCGAVSDGTRDLYQIVQPQIAHGRFPPVTQPGVGQCQMVPETCTTLSSHRSRTAGFRQPHSQVWGSVRWYPRPVPHCPATDRAWQVPASHTARCGAESDGTRDLYQIVQPQIAHGRFPPVTQPGVGQCQMVPETCTRLSSHRSHTAGSRPSHS